MKDRWLRRLLLGVSLALLLGGGVALAQGLFVTVDKDCVECWSGSEKPTQDRYLLGVTLGGWNSSYKICERVTIDGVLLYDECGGVPFPQDPYSFTDWFPCEFEGSGLSVLGLGVDLINGPSSPLGVWVLRWSQPEAPGGPVAQASWLVAEVCEVQFVPEPGSILLLGSGLMGLAGYAGLQFRRR